MNDRTLQLSNGRTLKTGDAVAFWSNAKPCGQCAATVIRIGNGNKPRERGRIFVARPFGTLWIRSDDLLE